MAPMMTGLAAVGKGFGSLMAPAARMMDPGRFGAFGTDPGGASSPFAAMGAAGRQAGNFMLNRLGQGSLGGGGNYGQPLTGAPLPNSQQPMPQTPDSQGSNPYLELRKKWRWEG